MIEGLKPMAVMGDAAARELFETLMISSAAADTDAQGKAH